MFQDVDQASERVADEKARHAPWLSDRAIFDLQPCGLHLRGTSDKLSTSIERSGTVVPDPPSVATLICGVILASAANVVIHPRSITMDIPSKSP
jgi:hypothetical protein